MAAPTVAAPTVAAPTVGGVRVRVIDRGYKDADDRPLTELIVDAYLADGDQHPRIAYGCSPTVFVAGFVEACERARMEVVRETGEPVKYGSDREGDSTGSEGEGNPNGDATDPVGVGNGSEG